MSYSSLNRAEASPLDVPVFERVSPENYKGQAAISAYTLTSKSTPIQTWIRISNELANEADLYEGESVSLLRGTGKDTGKLRIVSNPDGSLTLSRRKNALYVRTNRLLSRKSKAKTAKVTSIASGALTLVY